jgi:hypothetical protein
MVWFVGMGSKGWRNYSTRNICLRVHRRGFRCAGGTQQARKVHISSRCNFFQVICVHIFTDLVYINISYDTTNSSYFYDINARVNDMSRLIEEQVQYVIDATKNGNVSRFINHRWAFKWHVRVIYIFPGNHWNTDVRRILLLFLSSNILKNLLVWSYILLLL